MTEKLIYILFYLFTASVTLCGVTSCDEEDEYTWVTGSGNNNSGEGEGEGESGGSGSENNNLGESVVYQPYQLNVEVPALKEGNLYVYHNTISGSDSVMTYCYEYNPEKQHTRWIAFRFDGKTRAKSVSRSDAWSDDPKLPVECHIGTEGFSGFDRGHICASADRLYSYAANAQTFYMCNMSPQYSRFNQNYWVAFEGHVQDLGRNASFADTLYVVKGGTIEDNQILSYVHRYNGASVAVPAYYFMALLKVKNNVYTGIAFWTEHKNTNYGNVGKSAIAAAAVTIDELEEKTGIDFFHNLPDAAETAVEKSFTLSAWSL